MSNPTTRPTTADRSDAELVSLAVGGDRDGFAAIYDRYGDRLYTTCVHMLRDPHDGADCAADVFLIAAERLHQLRDPSRLKSWLFAIARHEVYRRTKHRHREIPTDDMTDTPTLEDEVATDPDAARRLLADAAQGLDERDQLVLSLTLAGDLEGDDLAGALGTSTATAHVVAHRMRERLATSVGALLVARGGHGDCEDLRKVLDGWDGSFTVLTRKRVARHIEQCDVCDERRQRVPVALLSAGPALAAPPGIRERILGDLSLVSHTGSPWQRDGFPPRPARAWRATRSGSVRRGVGIVAAVALLIAGIGGAWWGIASREGEDVSTIERADSSVSTTSTTDAPAGSEPPPSVVSAPTVTSSVPPTTDPLAVEPTSTTSATTDVVTTVPPSQPGGPTTIATPRGAVLNASPTSLDLGTTQRSGSLTVTNSGEQTGSITTRSTANWLSASPVAIEVAPGGSTTVTVLVNRGSAPEGDLSAAIELLASDGTTLSVPVRMNTNAGPSVQLTVVPNQFNINGSCTVMAAVSDQSAVNSVVVVYSTANGTAQTALSMRGTNWLGSVAVGGSPRQVTWRVIATDALGNQTRTPDRNTVAGSFCG